jgi:hypothetical protein
MILEIFFENKELFFIVDSVHLNFRARLFTCTWIFCRMKQDFLEKKQLNETWCGGERSLTKIDGLGGIFLKDLGWRVMLVNTRTILANTSGIQVDTRALLKTTISCSNHSELQVR